MMRKYAIGFLCGNALTTATAVYASDAKERAYSL